MIALFCSVRNLIFWIMEIDGKFVYLAFEPHETACNMDGL